MVQIIMGLKGSGKTKKLVDLVREAVNEETGDVVCIEKERKLTFDIPYQARLIEAGSYDVGNYEFLKGLICGVHAGNYDITHFFIDNFYKLVNDKSVEALEEFLAWLEKFSNGEIYARYMDTVRGAEAAERLLSFGRPLAVCGGSGAKGGKLK